MAVIILVHGAFHGRWCFRKLIPTLEAHNHQVIAIDLPGHGVDETDPSSVTMDDYVTAVRQTIDTVEHVNPILIGHSMAGMVVSAVAEQCAKRLAGLGYIAAYLPKSGESLMTIETRNPSPKMPGVISPSADMSTASINAEGAAPLFYNGCDESDQEFAKNKLCVQPGAPFLTPVFLSDSAFGSVPKGYFMCEQDQTIPLALQQDMVSAQQDISVYRLASGHSPFFSHAEELGETISQFAQSIISGTSSEAA